MTVEEKIRRAEEIYERRKQGEARPVAKVTVNDKKDLKLLKKMIIQILICVVIYLVFFIIQNQEYVFSKDFVNKANEILSYDTNFLALYEMVKGQIMSFTQQEQGQQEQQQEQQEEQQEQPDQQQEQGNLPLQTSEPLGNEAIGGAEEGEIKQPENLSQEEIDIQNIKNTTSFIKPIEGVISSSYGQRDSATGNVPKNHTGTDIAANLGTKIIAATEGEVVLASEEGDYRKTLKNSNRRS